MITQEKKSSVWSVVVNLCCITIGFACAGLPFAFRCAGLTSGILVCLIIAAIEVYSIKIVAYNAIKYKSNTLQDLIRKSTGKALSWASVVMQIGYGYALCVIGWILVGDLLRPVILQLCDSDDCFWADRRLIIACTSLFIVFPLCLGRSAVHFTGVSFISVFLNVFLTVLLIIKTLKQKPVEEIPLWQWKSYVVYAFTIFMLAFQAHAQIPTLVFELNEDSLLFCCRSKVVSQQEQLAIQSGLKLMVIRLNTFCCYCCVNQSLSKQKQEYPREAQWEQSMCQECQNVQRLQNATDPQDIEICIELSNTQTPTNCFFENCSFQGQQQSTDRQLKIQEQQTFSQQTKHNMYGPKNVSNDLRFSYFEKQGEEKPQESMIENNYNQNLNCQIPLPDENKQPEQISSLRYELSSSQHSTKKSESNLPCGSDDIQHPKNLQYDRQLNQPFTLSQRRKQILINKVIVLSYIFIAILYLALGISGYVLWPDAIGSNVINCLSRNDVFIQILRGLLGIGVFLNYPISQHVARVAIYDLLARVFNWKSQRECVIPYVKIFLITVTFFVSSVSVSLIVSDLGMVFHLIGGIGSASFIFIFPGLMMFQANRKNQQKSVCDIPTTDAKGSSQLTSSNLGCNKQLVADKNNHKDLSIICVDSFQSHRQVFTEVGRQRQQRISQVMKRCCWCSDRFKNFRVQRSFCRKQIFAALLISIGLVSVVLTTTIAVAKWPPRPSTQQPCLMD